MFVSPSLRRASPTGHPSACRFFCSVSFYHGVQSSGTCRRFLYLCSNAQYTVRIAAFFGLPSCSNQTGSDALLPEQLVSISFCQNRLRSLASANSGAANNKNRHALLCVPVLFHHVLQLFFSRALCGFLNTCRPCRPYRVLREPVPGVRAYRPRRLRWSGPWKPRKRRSAGRCG